MSDNNASIFRRYYTDEPFVDRYLADPTRAVDVIIPVIHTNELWRANLLSFYREIPIHKLLIGDGGCIDNSIDIAKEFPRVQILDHRSYKTLGYSVRKLIEAVEMDWFIYIHSDAYLPPGWFNAMQKHQPEYDWFGCSMQHTIMVEYAGDFGERPWAGSQMGRKLAFESGLQRIEDDYVYRQEDFIFADIVKKAGYQEGKVSDTFHYHQTIHKPSPWARKIKSLNLDLEMSREEKARTYMMQAKGLVKYLDPDPYHEKDIVFSLNILQEMGELTWEEFYDWVKIEKPAWLPILRRRNHGAFLARLKTFLRAAYRLVIP